ncbi:MAG: hypothetical protein HRT64_13305 [Erythrobacter sp.]|nr:hypothetical protein [Erythrobacter sp.]
MTTPDFLYSAGADTRMLEGDLNKAAKHAEGAFGRVGTAIEKQTAGARKFSGALSSTVGIVTGIGGAMAFIAGVGASVVSIYDEMANAAERVASANRKTADEIDRLLRQANSQLGFGSELESRIESVVGPLRATLESLREEYDELALGGLDALSPRVMYGGIVESFGGTTSRADRRDFLAVRMSEIEGQIRSLTDATTGQFEQEAANRVRDLVRETQLLRVKSLGYDELAQSLERARDVESELSELQAEADVFRAEGLDNAANAIERVILQRRQLNDVIQSNIDKRNEEERQQKAMDAQRAGADLQFQLEQRIRRATGDEEGASLNQILRDAERMSERIREMDLDSFQEFRLLGLVRQLREAQLSSLSGDQVAQLGVQLGPAAAGNVGSLAASQILGGTQGIERRLDEQRNSTLADVSNTAKEILVAVRDSTGTAVLG